MDDLYYKINYSPEVDFYLSREVSFSVAEIKQQVKKYLTISESEDVFYAKRNRKVIKNKLKEKKVYAKNYSPLNAKKWYDKLKDITLFKSVARKELEALLLLEGLEIPVVKPLLAIEKKLSPFMIESTIITLAFDGIEAEEIMFSNKYQYQLKKSIMQEAAKNLLKMHRANVVHNDYRFRNLLIKLKDAEEFEMAIIDFQKAKLDYNFRYRKIKDWSKLVGDWLNGILSLSLDEKRRFKLVKEEVKKYKQLLIEQYNLNTLDLKLFHKWTNKIYKGKKLI